MRPILTTIPYGWQRSLSIPGQMFPLPHEQEALVGAKEQLEKGGSLRDVAAWMERVSGRKLSHQGLKRIRDRGWESIDV